MTGAPSRTQYQLPSAHAGTAALGSNPEAPGVNWRTAGIGALQPVADDSAYGRRCPRLCENTQELTRRRIVFSIALFPTAATALFVFKLTKSRSIFYAKIERLCFHTASPRSGHRSARPVRPIFWCLTRARDS